MSNKDYYKILGVSKTDSLEDIKKAYKKLALTFHPDRAPTEKKEEYEEKFKEISAAYAILSDPEKRKQYDQFGPNSFDQRYNQEDIFRGADFSSIFEEIFGEGFGGFTQNTRENRGNDLQYNLTISFEDSVKGLDQEIEYKKNVLCKKCAGTGAKNKKVEPCKKCKGEGIFTQIRRTVFGIINQQTVCDECNGRGEIPKENCPECNGKGIIKQKVKVNIKIPAGINNGNVLIASGQGDEVSNGNNGDLQVVVHVTPHKIFHREGDDLQMIYQISYPQAALGDKIKIPTPYGNTKIKIPSGFTSGTVMRIKGQGMENVNGYARGDLYVQIDIKTLKRLNRKQKKLLEELKKLDEEE